MNIAWSIGFHGNLYYKTTDHNYAAWFIGGIIGAVLSCFLTNKIAKKYVLVSNQSIKITRHLHTSLEIKIKLHNNLNVQAVPTFFKFNN